MKLKPCPFCAREARIIKLHPRIFTIVCECGAESPKDSVSAGGAVRIWNRRRYLEIMTKSSKEDKP
jgi:hypothetical protein